MEFTRLLYEGEDVWGVHEGKYLRVLDGAPWEDWNYAGPEVRLARAKLGAPATGRLTVVREGGAVSGKDASRVLTQGGAVRCPGEGLELLCGLAALIGADGAPCAYTLFCGGGAGPFASDAAPAEGTLSLRVGGGTRWERPVEECLAALRAALESAAQKGPLRPGDLVAAGQPAWHALPGDPIELAAPGFSALRLTLAKR